MGPFAALLPALGAAMGTIGGTAAAGAAGGTIAGMSAGTVGMLGGAIGSGIGMAAADMMNSNQQSGGPSQGMPAPPPMAMSSGRFGSGSMVDPNSLIVPTQLPPPMFPTQTGMTREQEEYLRRLGLI